MLKKMLLILYKIFFVGLILQFFLQTFVTYQLGLDQSWMQYVRLWKEGIVVVMGLLMLYGLVVQKKWRNFIASKQLLWWLLVLLIAVGLTAYIHLVLLGKPLTTYVLAFKYDFLGFFILLVGFWSGGILSAQERRKLVQRYVRVMQWMLVGAIVWYAIIFIKPGTLKLFGYDNFMYEGDVGVQPPAAYYTQINHGITRNQFVFERPISRGFFLIAMFPLFYSVVFHRQKLRTTRLRRGLYASNIILTFSRAARGAWIIQLVLLGIILHRDQLKVFVRKVLLPSLLGLGVIGYLGYDHIFQRDYSTNGHIEMLTNGIKLYTKSPLIGHGGGRAGPASHREGGPKFNPENQFLQILIEFGAIGFLSWFWIYLTLHLVGIMAYHHDRHSIHSMRDEELGTKPSLLLLAMSLGLVGLSAEGMLLHSFSDRMTVYPFMLLFGILWWHQVENTQFLTEDSI